jgi:hypothetical protein
MDYYTALQLFKINRLKFNKTKKDLVQDRELDSTGTNFNQCKPIRSNLNQYEPTWSNFINFNLFLSILMLSNPIWSSMIQFDPI